MSQGNGAAKKPRTIIEKVWDNHVVAERQGAPTLLFIAETAAQAGTLYPVPCGHLAACAGQEPRIWIIGIGDLQDPYQAVTAAEAALLRPHYRLSYRTRVPSLTVFLLVRT